MDAIGKISFWMGILCELIVSVSGYAFGGYHEPMIIVTGMLFFSISICMHLELKKNWLLYLICAVVGLGYYYLHSSALILRILLILLAGREQKAEPVIKAFFWGTLIIMIYTAVLAVLGLHNTVSLTQNFRHEEETRYCFGFYHPNGFAFFLFRTLVLGLYTYGKQLKLWMMAVVAAGSMIFFWMAGSKMGMTAAVCVIVAFWLVRFFKTDQARKMFYFLGNVLIGMEVMFLMVSMVWFEPSAEIELTGVGFWQILNELTTGRLFFIHKTYLAYPIPLWGYQGFMEATEVGFVNALYNQGLIFLVVYLAALFYLFYRMFQKKDMSALVMILGFTLYAMAEAFLPYFNKNGVWMLFLGWNLYWARERTETVIVHEQSEVAAAED